MSTLSYPEALAEICGLNEITPNQFEEFKGNAGMIREFSKRAYAPGKAIRGVTPGRQGIRAHVRRDLALVNVRLIVAQAISDPDYFAPLSWYRKAQEELAIARAEVDAVRDELEGKDLRIEELEKELEQLAKKQKTK
jgi:hypothetical protein